MRLSKDLDGGYLSAEFSCFHNQSFFLVCQRKADRVIGASSEENLQPFKEKMEVFLEKGKFLIFCI